MRDCFEPETYPHYVTFAARGRKWFTYRCTEGAFAVPSIARTGGANSRRTEGGRQWLRS